MDFFAQVNERLLQPPEPKSSLRSYFEAHLLFQDAYHSPSASPESSPEPEERIARPALTHSKKRRHDSDDEGYNSAVPVKRQRMTLGVHTAPSPPATDDSMPPSPTRFRRVSTQDSAFHEEVEEDKMYDRFARVGASATPPMSPQPLPQRPQQHTASTKTRKISKPKTTRKPESMNVGRYSLRWTAARAKRADG